LRRHAEPLRSVVRHGGLRRQGEVACLLRPASRVADGSGFSLTPFAVTRQSSLRKRSPSNATEPRRRRKRRVWLQPDPAEGPTNATWCFGLLDGVVAVR